MHDGILRGEKNMNDASETKLPGWQIDPVAGTMSGELPVTLAVDSRSMKPKAIVCIVLAVAAACGYAADTTLWPAAVLAALLALAGGAFFLGSRRKMALVIDETGFQLVGSMREKPAIRWRDVTGFAMISVAGNRYIGYQFSEHASRTPVPGGVMLPVSRFVGLPLEAVAGLLELCREQFGTADGGPGARSD